MVDWLLWITGCGFQVFGADVTDVTMCQGLLIIMHQSRLVRFYDFDHLLREHQVKVTMVGMTMLIVKMITGRVTTVVEDVVIV